ncbi:hypothetical protein BGZ58_002571 [Dissophora ornata]|nr:hypothetical protein BGZ58_002571 [Dissophora ornata]
MNSQDAILSDIHKDLLGRNVPTRTSQDLDGAYSKHILLTGGAGFIGSVLVRKLVLNYPEYFILVIDKLDYCSSFNNLHPFLQPPPPPSPPESDQVNNGSTPSKNYTDKTTPLYSNFEFLEGDITDLETVQMAMMKYQIDTVIHLAAQTHVDKSFGESIEFTKNNVLGAHVMLEAARRMFCQFTSSLGKNGGSLNDDDRKRRDAWRFIYVSTDEVYGEVPFGQPDCKEDAPLAPSNPYSATKAAAECMVQAYHKSFHLPVIITRSNNVYGPFQYPEKIFPKFIMSLLNSNQSGADTDAYNDIRHRLSADFKGSKNRKRTRSQGGGHCYIHGSGEHSRTYLYVTDVADALDVILHRGEVGQVYNIGAGHEMNNLELAQDLIHRMVTVPQPLPPTPLQQQQEEDEDLQTRSGTELEKDNCIKRDFTANRQDEAEQHLKQCKTCADRIVFVEDRAFNDRRYAVDATRLLGLGWSPKVQFEDGIGKTRFRFSSYLNSSTLAASFTVRFAADNIVSVAAIITKRCHKTERFKANKEIIELLFFFV